MKGMAGNDNKAVLLAALRTEHRKLDDAIRNLSGTRFLDQLRIQRLKKKKLSLKERIRALEDATVPDIIA